MKSLTLPAATFIAFVAGVLFAAPDFSAAYYAAIRENFEKKTVAIEATRQADVRQMLENQIRNAAQREIKSRVSGNVSMKADVAQLVKMLADAQESFEKKGTFAFPDKIRPANESVAALCLQALRNADNAASDAKAILLSNSQDELRKILEDEGIKPTHAMLEAYWKSLMTGAPAPYEGGSGHGGTAVDTSAADDGDGAICGISRPGNNWRHLVRIDITTPDAVLFEVPLFPLEAGKKSVRGTGLNGGSWEALLSAPSKASAPRGSAAFRIKRIGGKGSIDVLTWPSASNGWTMELRARNSSAASGNACLIEIGE